MTANKKKNYGIGLLILEIIMLLLSIIAFAPMLYQLVSSFKNKSEIRNYKDALLDGNFLVLFKNSLLIAAISIAIIIVIGSMASYPLSRNAGKKYKYLYYYFLSGIMIPFQAGMILLYKLIKSIGLMNNIMGIVLVSVGICIPMSVLIFAGFIKTIPIQLEESARIDGCGTKRIFFTIVFPLLMPAIISSIIINIISIWNNFLTPLLFLSSSSKKTLPLGMYNFMGLRTMNWGPVFAFTVLSCIAPIILFLLLQKYFYKGIMSGALKE